jgi:hypothetical protein
MPSSFAITSPSNTIALNAKGQGDTTFTVTNTSGRALRGRARLVPKNPDAAAWLKLLDEAERDFDAGATQQYVVQVAVPPTAAHGSYSFSLDMVGLDNPDENYTQGPAMSFQITTAPVPAKKPFPWWILAIVAIVILAAVVVAAIIMGRSPAAPPAETPTVAVVATETSAPTDTPVAPTSTSIPPTDASVPPTDTPIPPTDTPIPPTPVPWTLFVEPGGRDANTCRSATLPCRSIGAAIEKAGAGEMIGIAPGIYQEHIIIAKNVQLMGSTSGSTIVDGLNTGRVFEIKSGSTVVLANLTVQNGKVVGANAAVGSGAAGENAYGGGILNNGDLTLINSAVVSNSVVGGNGGSGAAGTVGGKGANGGNGGDASCNAGGCSGSSPGGGGGTGVSGSAGGSGGNGGDAGGGGIANFGTLRLRNTTVSNNDVKGGDAAQGGIGGMGGQGGDGGKGGNWNYWGCYATNGNNGGSGGLGGPGGTGGAGGRGGAGQGGGNFNGPDATLLLSNSTIAYHTNVSGGAGGAGGSGGVGGSGGAGGAGGAGGSICSRNIGGGSPGATGGQGLAGQTGPTGPNAVGAGAGLYNAGSATLQATILSNNTVAEAVSECAGKILASNGFNLIKDGSSCTIRTTQGDIVGTSALPKDPGLGPLQYNRGVTLNRAVMSDSVAIDDGDVSPGPLCEQTDQRGIARPKGAACDIGAYEFDSSADSP